MAMALQIAGCAAPQKSGVAAGGAKAESDVASNFGFPLGFSPLKMDTTADPRQDFRRYAGGRWLDAAIIPGDALEISGYKVMEKAVERQLEGLLQEAAAGARSMPAGSPTQLVGDFFASGLDIERLKALGVTPIAADLDRIAKTQGPTQLAETSSCSVRWCPPTRRTAHAWRCSSETRGLASTSTITSEPTRRRSGTAT
jgi:putative endopeptidase